MSDSRLSKPCVIMLLLDGSSQDSKELAGLSEKLAALDKKVKNERHLKDWASDKRIRMLFEGSERIGGEPVYIYRYIKFGLRIRIGLDICILVDFQFVQHSRTVCVYFCFPPKDAVTFTWGGIKKSGGEEGVKLAMEAVIGISGDLDQIEADAACLVELKAAIERRRQRAHALGSGE